MKVLTLSLLWGAASRCAAYDSLTSKAESTWAASQPQWVGPQIRDLQRLAVLALVLLGSALIYFGALWAAGLKLRAFVRR